MPSISLILPYYERLQYVQAALDSFQHFYAGRRDLEIVLVDDGSSEAHRLEPILPKYPKLTIKLVRLDKKTGINPCYPYNVGVRASTGDVLILSSPEIVHTKRLFQFTDFSSLTKDDYYAFSVFCPTDDWLNRVWLDPKMSIPLKLGAFRSMNPDRSLHDYLGMWGKESFANKLGSWYLHSKHRPSALNFCTALRREKFVELGGFDERFRNGTGHDDAEFRDRLLASGVKVRYFDDFIGLHLNHPPVYGKGDPVSNQALYDSLATNPYLSNDDWGKL